MIDGRLSSLDRLPKHRKLLERAVARFQDDVRVVGLVAGGSLVHGAADFYSDVDLYILHSRAGRGGRRNLRRAGRHRRVRALTTL